MSSHRNTIIMVVIVFVTLVWVAAEFITNPIISMIDEPSLVIIQVDNRFKSSYTGQQNWTNIKQQNEFWEQTAEINRRYAEKWGYEYKHIVTNESRLTRKIEEVAEFLTNKKTQKDWILFMDSDAFVSQQDWTLQTILNGFNVSEKIHLLIEHEPPFRANIYAQCNEGNGLTHDRVANSGVYLLRNSQIGEDIMKEWVKGILRHPEWRNSWPGDQAIFNCDMTTHDEFADNIRIAQCQSFSNIVGKAFGGFVDAWVQHYCSGNPELRYREISRFLDDLQANIPVNRNATRGPVSTC